MLFLVNSNGVPSVAKFSRFPLGSATAPPTPPGSLNALGGIGTVSLTWSPSMSATGVANYNVHRATTPSFAPTSLNRIGQPTSTNYTDSGLAAGTYYYVVTAEDVQHNISLPSNESFAAVTADTNPPTVTLESPTSTTVTGVVTLSANAADDNGVAGVRFLLDGANLGAEITSPPYATTWNSTTTTNGTHTLAARARDIGGNTVTSQPRTVMVSNATPSGLVAAYSFAEGSGTTTADLSGNGNVGTLSGATWSTAGKNGNSLQFNGSNALVSVADAASLRLTTGMTIEAWVRPSLLNSWRTVILKEDTSELAYGLYANTDTVRPGIWVRGGTASEFVKGTAQLALNTWTHLASTYDGSMLRLYVNGNQVTSKVVGTTINATSRPLRIGGNTVWGEYFQGLIDDVRIYNRALSPSEIQTDMNTPVGP
jgi:concanavalin A-like lectin/glucanase superfamily protein/Big-like domain-containing protein